MATKQTVVVVSVTKDHIKKGVKSEKDCCPMALAMKDAGCKDVIVDRTAMFFRETNGDENAIVLPDDVKRFVDDFDRGMKVKPITFKLTL